MKTLKKPGYSNDDWTIEFGDLGFLNAGEELYEMAVQAPAPFVIGVCGGWGSGKTSLLRYCMASLGGLPLSCGEGIGVPKETEIFSDTVRGKWDALGGKKREHSALTVWFNPWQYQNEPNLMIPLLHEIRKQIPKWAEAKFTRKKLRSAGGQLLNLGFKKLTEVIDTVIEKNIGFKPMGSLYEKGKELYKGSQPAVAYREVTDAQQLFLAFNGAVRQVLNSIKELSRNSGPDKLVIFIDDLDRCEDRKILEVLETIKLYLNTNSCIFILGIDPEAVEKTIIRYRKNCEAAEARQYMAKLVQGNIHVPVCSDFRPFIKRIIDQWPKDEVPEGEKEKLAEVVNEIWEHNPRKVKNFLNALLFRWKLINKQKPVPTLHQSALLLSLQFRFPVIYKSIAFHPENFGHFCTALVQVIQSESTGSPHTEQTVSAGSEMTHRYIEEMATVFRRGVADTTSLDAYQGRLFEYTYDRRLFMDIHKKIVGDWPKLSREKKTRRTKAVKAFFTTEAGGNVLH